jgi:hypothetical protein
MHSLTTITQSFTCCHVCLFQNCFFITLVISINAFLKYDLLLSMDCTIRYNLATSTMITTFSNFDNLCLLGLFEKKNEIKIYNISGCHNK